MSKVWQRVKRAFPVTSPGAPEETLQAAALESWFRYGDFAYNESAPYLPGADNPFSVMEAFLETRSGFCVHFASTFAVMARSVGIPTRVAVGYVSGSEPGSQTSVRNNELHAWPEIYQDGFGWVAFEPTPGGAGVRAETGDDVPVEPEVEEAPETPDAANPQREEISEEDVTADDAANAERYGTPESSIPGTALQSALDDCVAELRAHASHSQRFLAVVWPRSLWSGPTPTRRS